MGFVGIATLTDEVVDGLTDEIDEEGTIVLSIVATDEGDVYLTSLDIALMEDVWIELETDGLEDGSRFGKARIWPCINDGILPRSI